MDGVHCVITQLLPGVVSRPNIDLNGIKLYVWINELVSRGSIQAKLFGLVNDCNLCRMIAFPPVATHLQLASFHW